MTLVCQGFAMKSAPRPMPEIQFLLGGSYPADQHIEDALCDRLPWMAQRYQPFLARHTAGRKIDRMDEGLDCLTREFGPGRAVVLIGRSSGARLATLFAARHPDRVAAVVAIGYPFRHPDHGPEPDRVAHLANLACPTLILQGSRDEYGGLGVGQLYPLSPAIALQFTEATHAMRLTPAQWDGLAARIARFLGDTCLP